MYQNDWVKIKEDLDKGADFTVVLERYMHENTQAVMATAERTLTDIKGEWNRIVLDYLTTVPRWVLNLFQFIESPGAFAAAILNLAGIGNTESPPQPSEVPPDPTKVNIPYDTILTWSDAKLTLELNAPTQDYDEQTLSNIALIHQHRLNNQETEEEEEQVIYDTHNDLLQTEIQYLVKLQAVPNFARFWDTYLPGQADGGDTIIAFFRLWNMSTATSVRTRSAASDAVVNSYLGRLGSARAQLTASITDPGIGSPEQIQTQINLLQTIIYFHLLVYSR